MRWPTSIFTVLIFCACGPKDPGDTDTDSAGTLGETGSDSDTATGTDTATGPDTATATDTVDPPTTGSTTDEPEQCVGAAAPIGPGIDILIRNATAARVFVRQQVGCESVRPFALVGPDDQELKIDLGSFEFTCAEASGGECGRNPGCPQVGVVTQIEPGSVFRTAWSGAFYAEADLSEACAEQLCGGCWLDQSAPNGMYTVQVRHSAEIGECSEGACPECEPGPEGVCTTEGIQVGAAVVEAVIDYPNAAMVELVIQ